MKNIFVIIAAMFLSSAVYAQVHFNVNLGGQPSWGHSGYNSHRVMIYHRQPVRYNVIFRDRYYGNENNSGYDRIPLQKHDNGKHNGWYKGNNGNGNGNGRGNDNGYNNGNGNENYNGNDNGNYNRNDNGNGNYNGNDNGKGNYQGNTNEKGNDAVPDKYKSNDNGNDVVPDKYK
jgi:hypothetical protein